MSFSGVTPEFRWINLKDDSAGWATNNPILEESELGFDTDVQDFKIGDGITPWASLPFYKDSITVSTPIPYESFETGTTSLNGASQIVPMNTEVDAVAGYSLSGGGIQVTDAGSYTYDYSVSGDSTDNDRAAIQASIFVNGVELNRTRSFSYHRNVATGEGTSSKSGKLVLSAGDVVTVRALIFGDNVTTIDQASNLMLEKKS